MRKVYKTKIDLALPILIVSGMISPIILLVREHDWFGLGILVSTLLFLVYLFYNTDYTISDTTLRVRSGFLVNKKIDIALIHTIKQTDSLWSAPAGSITDRIEIAYQKSEKIVISPKEKQDFVNELLKINPNIKIEI